MRLLYSVASFDMRMLSILHQLARYTPACAKSQLVMMLLCGLAHMQAYGTGAAV